MKCFRKGLQKWCDGYASESTPKEIHNSLM